MCNLYIEAGANPILRNNTARRSVIVMLGSGMVGLDKKLPTIMFIGPSKLVETNNRDSVPDS